MARDWPEILNIIEGHYPTSIGDTGRDRTLRISLTKFANQLFKSIERERRWSLAYTSDETVVTTANLSDYLIPSNVLTISRLYRRTATGSIVPLDLFDAGELRAVHGEGADSIAGPPVAFAIKGLSIQLFPKPDNAGPTAGNYTLVFEGQTFLPPIVETTGITTAASAVLTVPAGGYLTTGRGLATSGSYLSVRGAGYLGALSVADSHLTSWSAIGATTVTMGVAAVTAVPTPGGQAFFNSLNWLIRDFDHVVTFGVLREVAAYLKENYSTWNTRFKDAMEELAAFDFDRRKMMGMKATAVTGQEQGQLRNLDSSGIAVRGNVYW